MWGDRKQRSQVVTDRPDRQPAEGELTAPPAEALALLGAIRMGTNPGGESWAPAPSPPQPKNKAQEEGLARKQTPRESGFASLSETRHSEASP